jgi:hypothetical protein
MLLSDEDLSQNPKPSEKILMSDSGLNHDIIVP